MNNLHFEDKIGLDVKTLKIVHKILIENPHIKTIFESSETYLETKHKLRQWVLDYLHAHPHALNYYLKKARGMTALKRISWRDYAAIRLMDYLDNDGKSFSDPNRKNKRIVSQPIKNLWLAIHYGKGSAKADFFIDMLYLFRQFNGLLLRRVPKQEQVNEWMDRHLSGLDDDIQEMRQANKERILKVIIRKIDRGEIKSGRFSFKAGISEEEKFETAMEWWNDHRFHLTFAVKTPGELNEMLDHSLRENTLKTLKKAESKGIPIFVNPHYLSLISVNTKPGLTGADQALREYILPNKELISEFGNIHAWEKEDIIQPGEPNAAGWILPPFQNVHRRYPEVAILIPDTAGRACGGLCVSCQRMYDFQSGRFNFDLLKLTPKISWPEKLEQLLKYWEGDTQLRDILITGGDAFMNSDHSLKQILDGVLHMAERKRNANLSRPDGEKYAEISRVRLGTRLPVYIPQRVTDEMVEILKEFRNKASKIGIRQFVVQTHIQSAMEITPETKKCIEKLISAGWVVTNQMVFTTASSRRGHTAKLRKVLNDIGVIPYYTFSVKGFMENNHNFATNERLVQERVEEKYLGKIDKSFYEDIKSLPRQPRQIVNALQKFREGHYIPFLATDRSVLNMPGVGKSMTFRTIGITNDGRRILEFEHDHTRVHSPVIDSMVQIVIIESKSIQDYMIQIEKIGEDPDEYKTAWGYSLSDTENRMPIYQYPGYDFKITSELKNFMSDPNMMFSTELIGTN
ncbi:MAG: KamA family protein [Bacteroidales bacterium]|jgi:lysine 2,3-aminomutase|nr:KamA family protein [Bacteroidales bacterium]